MFGSSTNGANPGGASSNRPSAAEVARIEGNLTHILIDDERQRDGISVFVNAQPLLIGDIESISIAIIAPSDQDSGGTLTALLSRYVTDANGQRRQESLPLFPGTVEVIARGRRITVTCQQPGSFDGLWLGLGLRSDGTSTELTGVERLQVTIAPETGLIDAKLTWSDNGAVEDLLG